MSQVTATALALTLATAVFAQAPDFSGTWVLDASSSSATTGTFVMQGTVDASGRVIDAKVLRSTALLDQAALDAVRQWRFTPTTLNGVPVPVIVSLSSSAPPSARVTIKQDRETLIETRDGGTLRDSMKYRLDGGEGGGSIAGRGANASLRPVARSHWDAGRLVTVFTAPDTGAVVHTETRYLDGDTMVVEIATPRPSGAPAVGKFVYRKPKG